MTFGSKKKVIKTPSTTLKIKLNNGKHLTVRASILVVPDITRTIQRKPISFPQRNQIDHLLKSLDMAETLPTARECSSVELLIGNNYYLDIVLPQRIEEHVSSDIWD